MTSTWEQPKLDADERRNIFPETGNRLNDEAAGNVLNPDAKVTHNIGKLATRAPEVQTTTTSDSAERGPVDVVDRLLDEDPDSWEFPEARPLIQNYPWLKEWLESPQFKQLVENKHPELAVRPEYAPPTHEDLRDLMEASLHLLRQTPHQTDLPSRFGGVDMLKTEHGRWLCLTTTDIKDRRYVQIRLSDVPGRKIGHVDITYQLNPGDKPRQTQIPLPGTPNSETGFDTVATHQEAIFLLEILRSNVTIIDPKAYEDGTEQARRHGLSPDRHDYHNTRSLPSPRAAQEWLSDVRRAKTTVGFSHSQ